MNRKIFLFLGLFFSVLQADAAIQPHTPFKACAPPTVHTKRIPQKIRAQTPFAPHCYCYNKNSPSLFQSLSQHGFDAKLSHKNKSPKSITLVQIIRNLTIKSKLHASSKTSSKVSLSPPCLH